MCLDDETKSFFEQNRQSYKNVRVITLFELEEYDEALKSVKATRSIIEYYFTLSPCLPIYILEKFQVPHICSMDADILMLANPENLFKYLQNSSIVITPHKFSAELRAKEKYGIYNVSFQIFKNDKVGMACLQKWREQCIAWCGDYVDSDTGFFADQKYLDQWPEDYKENVTILDDEVSGLAPWNINRFKISYQHNTFYSNGKPIIFYHFHGFRFFTKKWASNDFNGYLVKRSKEIHQLYLYYWNEINETNFSLNLTASKSIRNFLNMDTIDRILNANGVYYKPSLNWMFEMNFSKLPGKIKGALKKIYGVFNKT